MDGEAWRAIVLGVTKSQTRLSDFTFTFTLHCTSLSSQGTFILELALASGDHP